MIKSKLGFILYSLALILISTLISVYCVQYFTKASVRELTNEQPDLIKFEDNRLTLSPAKDTDSVIEIFSYECHFCAVHEKDIQALPSMLPAGKRLIQIHMSRPGTKFSTTDTLFATLTVMGVEKNYREKIYEAVLKEKIDFADERVRDTWLQDNGINVEAFHKVSGSAETAELLKYMRDLTGFYKIMATPTFIINKKWVALQDRPYPEFNQQILSLVEKDRPLEK